MNRKSTHVLLVSMCILFFSCSETSSRKRNSREEAYTVIEDQTITLTYSVGEGLYYHRETGLILFDDYPTMEVYCYVTNTSDYGGLFQLYATLSSLGQTIDFSAEEYISSGSKVKISQTKEINHYSFEGNVKVENWRIVPPEKTIQVEVTKYRTVYD